MALVANKPMFKEHNTRNIFPLHSGALPNSSAEHIVFIIRPLLTLIDNVADNIHK